MAIETIYETCPHCDGEQGVQWDVHTEGYEIYCPSCGERMMLCSECEYANSGCDWSEQTGCRMQKQREKKKCGASETTITVEIGRMDEDAEPDGELAHLYVERFDMNDRDIEKLKRLGAKKDMSGEWCWAIVYKSESELDQKVQEIIRKLSHEFYVRSHTIQRKVLHHESD